MKKLKNVFLTAACVFMWAGVYAQSYVPAASTEASITTDYCVTVDNTQPLQQFYSIDIAHLGLESEYAAKKKFGHIQNNLISYHVDFENTKVILELHIDRAPEGTDVSWWNEYLSSLCSSK